MNVMNTLNWIELQTAPVFASWSKKTTAKRLMLAGGIFGAVSGSLHFWLVFQRAFSSVHDYSAYAFFLLHFFSSC